MRCEPAAIQHRSRFGDPAVRTFAQILDEFRQSYVLRYSANGVKGNGWHAVVVQVPAQPALTIKARSGYFARNNVRDGCAYSA